MTKAHILIICLYLFYSVQLNAEGSVDFINYPGYRLFLRADKDQQIKVFAKAGEYLNIGSSHVGIEGGFISVYRPDGTLHTVYDGSNASEAIIYSSTQELNGPIGSAAGGYEPGVIPVSATTEGVWSLVFSYPTTTGASYNNLLNNQAWIRSVDQPLNRRVVLSWDVTVSINAAANAGGAFLEGRVYTNEYNSMINENGATTSPRFFILTPKGLQYSVDFNSTDPWGFPLSSSSRGLLSADLQSTYTSWSEEDIIRSANPNEWIGNYVYQYEPQAEDWGTDIINNKIFFNIPNQDMPTQALTTDIFRNNTHTTWLYNEPEETDDVFNDYYFKGLDELEMNCEDGTVQYGTGAFFYFDSNFPGAVSLKLDFNNDGDFNDAEDRVIVHTINAGLDSVYWDGTNGMGNVFSIQDDLEFAFEFSLQEGENHILLADVENNEGGVTFELLNGFTENAADLFYYDHSQVGGAVSGGGSPGNPLATNIPFTYSNNFGNKKMLDYWTYSLANQLAEGTIEVDIVTDCTPPEFVYPDTDSDGIPDNLDIDDDNDGLLDLVELCRNGSSICLFNTLDPSGDEDGDEILNYKDADDPDYPNNCIDDNNDGICDSLTENYDTDADNIPDHLDLDSDNDGISDLYEAAHNAPDNDFDGVIDGNPSDFGQNGFFNSLASDPNDINATANYTPADTDSDNVIDIDDLDADNDGINDVIEAGHNYFDPDANGQINLEPEAIDTNGLAAFLFGEIFNPIDWDNDGIADFRDLDTDNDGINDVAEANLFDTDNDGIIGAGVPLVNYFGQATSNGSLITISNPQDKDSDSVADFRDLDADNDGINDVEEAGHTDPDNDGHPGTGMPIVNEYGQTPASDSAPEDWDEDGVPDYLDLDSDNDGINDVIEAGHTDPDNDGHPNTGMPTINQYGQTPVSTSAPQDWDKDGVSDYRDLDSDNDGINDVTEAGHEDPDNNGQTGTGMPMVNEYGQTPVSNSAPEDWDGDGVLDFHDLDSDNDGINDVEEAGNEDPDNDGLVGVGIPSVNENGQTSPENTGLPLDTDEDGTPDFHDVDSDGDGIDDVIEAGYTDEDNDGVPSQGTPSVNDNGQTNENTSNPPDTDQDGDPDYQDIDADNDGLADEDECPDDNTCLDWDNDGTPDFQDTDSDNDGIDDAYECPEGVPCPDTDGDGITDHHDLDTDNDGIPDEEECENGAPCPDSDDDGTPDWQDPDCVGVNAIQISAAVNSETYCEGETVTLTAQTNITGEAINFEWTGPNGTSFSGTATNDSDLTWTIDNSTVLNSGAYTISIETDDACEATAPSLSVNVTATPDTPILIVNENALCQGENLVLSSTPALGANPVYQWFFEGELIETTAVSTLLINDATLGNEGDYFVQIGVNDCFSSSSNIVSVSVSAAVENIQLSNTTSETTPVCEGGTVVLSTTQFAGASYQWFGPNGLVGNTFEVNMPNASTEDAGEYYVQVTFPECGMVESAPMEVFVGGAGVMPILAADNQAICEGGDVLLSIINDLDLNPDNNPVITWYDAVTNEFIAETNDLFFNLENMTETGEYFVSVLADGCETVSGSIEIVVESIPQETAQIQTPSFTLCENEGLILEATTVLEANGTWTGPEGVVIASPNASTTSVFNLAEGANTFVWTLSNESCGQYSSASVSVNSPAVFTAADDTFQLTRNEELESADILANDALTNIDFEISIIEEPAEGIASLNTDGSFNYLPTENSADEQMLIYQVCNSACPEDCTKARIFITIETRANEDCEIPNAITPNGDDMNDALEITCLNDNRYPENQIMIFNRWGDKVYEKVNYNNDWNGTFRGKQLPAGTYFFALKLEPDGEVIQSFFTIVY